MGQPNKIRYEIDLAQRGTSTKGAFRTRNLTGSDRDELANLILDAYRGTIDYEGETLVEAGEAIDEWLDESPLLAASFAALDGDSIVSATLATTLDGDPFIAIVMTHPDHKTKGYGTAAVEATLQALHAEGNKKVVLFITEGNSASETLFKTFGAQRVPSDQ